MTVAHVYNGFIKGYPSDHRIHLLYTSKTNVYGIADVYDGGRHKSPGPWVCFIFYGSIYLIFFLYLNLFNKIHPQKFVVKNYHSIWTVLLLVQTEKLEKFLNYFIWKLTFPSNIILWHANRQIKFISLFLSLRLSWVFFYIFACQMIRKVYQKNKSENAWNERFRPEIKCEVRICLGFRSLLVEL